MPDVGVHHLSATLTKHGEIGIPYWRVAAAREGPCLLITCAQHGCEVQGCEAARRFVEAAARELLCGEILVVPFANRPALWKRRHHISSAPERHYGEDDGHNMNRTWPGSPDGNDTERMSHAIAADLAPRATHNVDVHCWARFTAATALPRSDRPRSMELARVSALPFAQPRGGVGGTETEPKTPCTIGALFNDSGRASLSFELSGQYVILEDQVRLGLRSLVNIARVLEMLPGAPEGLDEGPTWLDRCEMVTVQAPADGLFVEAALRSADWVSEGQPLGHLLSDADLSVTEIFAPAGGRLFRWGCHREKCDVALPDMHPYASAGDTLAVIARPTAG